MAREACGFAVRSDATICLALADNKSQKYVSITGRAEIIDDRDRVKEVWSIYDMAFWPDKNDPHIRILRVTPESAEFWEGAGTVATAVKLVAAIASGERMNIGANGRVGFPQGGKVIDEAKLAASCRTWSNLASRRGSIEMVTCRSSPAAMSTLALSTRDRPREASVPAAHISDRERSSLLERRGDR
jgi:hypothetical protein